MTEELKSWQSNGNHFKFQGHRIFFRQDGAGENLLLIHGFPTASWDWHKMYEDLVSRYQVTAPDLIGFGFSDKPRNYPYSILDQADLCEALLRRLGIKNVHLLCHDYGDTVGQELLARWLDRKERGNDELRIASVCFLNGGLFPESHQPRLIQKLLISPIGSLLNPFLNKGKLRSNFNTIFGPETQASDKEIDEFYELIQYNKGKRVMNKLIRYMAERKQYRRRWVGALTDNELPMRLIDGSKDPISGRHLAERFEELVPDADVVHLEQIGHYPQTEAPELVLKHYFEFIAAH